MFNKTTLIVAAISSSLVLGGCNLNSFSSSKSPLDNDEFSVDSNSYAISCASGAIVAGGICLLIADSNNRAVCIAAAAGGCAAFMGGNYLLDNLRKNYHTKEQQLDGLINIMTENNNKARKMAAAAQDQYKKDKATLASIEKEIAQNKASKEKIEKQIASYNANIKVLEGNLEYHNKQLASYKEVRSQLSSGKLTAAERAKLKEANDMIASLEADIKLITNSLNGYIRDRDVLNLAATNLDKGTKV